MNKKLISLLLSAALAVSMLTVPAFAAEGGDILYQGATDKALPVGVDIA